MLRLAARFAIPFTIAIFALSLLLLLPRAFPLHNLFAPYLHLMPGQRFARDVGMWRYSEYEMMRPGELACTIETGRQDIRYIYVYSENGVIKHTSFSVRSLRVGELAALFGLPTSARVYRRGFAMQWENFSVWGRQYGGARLLWRVSYVSFHD